MLFFLTAWPEEEVLGLSIDTVMIGFVEQRLFFSRQAFVMIGFDVVRFPLCLLVDRREEEVLGLSMDTVMTGLFGQRLRCFKTHVVMIGFDVVLFPSCPLVDLIWPVCARR